MILTINHILGKLDRDGKTEVIEELANEAEDEVLQELRERVFILSKDIYESNLRETGTISKEEEVDIALQKRVKTTDTITLATDVVCLYEYTVGLATDFPKDVLTRSSKLKEIKKAHNGHTAETKKSDPSNEWKNCLITRPKKSFTKGYSMQK